MTDNETDLERPAQTPPPAHVLATFGFADAEPVPLDTWDGGYRAGETVFSIVPDHARAAWSAKVREDLYVDGLRIARPVRASDGRYVVSGWRADSYIAGAPEPRFDETVLLAERLHEATADLERPRFLLQQPAPPYSDVDVFAAADRAAWEEVPLRTARAGGMTVSDSPDATEAAQTLKNFATLRRRVTSTPQLVHGDLFGTVLFAGSAAPGIADITPYWRPAAWASAVVVVDAMAWGGADESLAHRWADQPEWSQMLLRALMFRLSVHALHPRSSAGALPGLLRAADFIRLMV